MSPIRKVRKITAAEAQGRLEALCARAERCTDELRKKLTTWQIESSEAQRIMESLIEGRWVDDRRFARAFVNDKVNFGRRGRYYLKRELSVKRIPRDIIDDVIGDIDEERYRENLMYILRTKTAHNPELLADFAGRTRLFRMAVSRGYEPAIVSETLRALIAAGQDDSSEE